jgi:hypothetical protein
MKKIIILACNDASDPRINKIINTYLINNFEVYPIYATKSEINENFIKYDYFKINLDYKNFVFTLFILYHIIRLRLKGYEYLHIIDEQMFLHVFYAKIFYKKVVLDIFDSIYLKFNFFKFFIPQNFLHSFATNIVVTDEARFGLLPNYSKSKAIILPNYPERSVISGVLSLARKGRSNSEITIGCFGSLTRDRGLNLLDKLLQFPNIKIICAGWCYDQFSRDFILKKNVVYLGVLNQNEILKITRSQVDFIAAIYPSHNLNNLYASPNKVWDSAAIGVPVILDYRTKISSESSLKNINVIVDKDSSSEDIYKKIISFDLKDGASIANFWDDHCNLLIDLYKSA